MNARGKSLAANILLALGGLFVTYLYNVVDGIFVGQGVGAAALGAVNVAVPFITFVVALIAMFPMGEATVAPSVLAEAIRQAQITPLYSLFHDNAGLRRSNGRWHGIFLPDRGPVRSEEFKRGNADHVGTVSFLLLRVFHPFAYGDLPIRVCPQRRFAYAFFRWDVRGSCCQHFSGLAVYFSAADGHCWGSHCLRSWAGTDGPRPDDALPAKERKSSD